MYRSFPITLFANVPYGMIMVGTNESLKQMWTQNGPLTLTTTLLASSMAGFVAAAATTPLDRIKTLLQTQQMAPACLGTGPLPKGTPRHSQCLSSRDSYFATRRRRRSLSRNCPPSHVSYSCRGHFVDNLRNRQGSLTENYSRVKDGMSK